MVRSGPVLAGLAQYRRPAADRAVCRARGARQRRQSCRAWLGGGDDADRDGAGIRRRATSACPPRSSAASAMTWRIVYPTYPNARHVRLHLNGQIDQSADVAQQRPGAGDQHAWLRHGIRRAGGAHRATPRGAGRPAKLSPQPYGSRDPSRPLRQEPILPASPRISASPPMRWPLAPAGSRAPGHASAARRRLPSRACSRPAASQDARCRQTAGNPLLLR